MATETYAEKQARLRRQRNQNMQNFAIAGMQAWSARKSAKYAAQARQNTGTDLGKLRKEATDNGFNPLTVLRATGGQGFDRDPDFGKIASSAFYDTFARGIGVANQQLQTNFDTPERNRHDIPLMVSVYDDSGNVEEFKIINPELIEMSGSEIRGSMMALAAQYATQHKISIKKARDILENIIDNRRANIGLEPVFPQTPPLETNGINKQSSFLDRLSHGFETGKWIFPEKKPNYNQQINGVPIDQQQRVLDSM